MSILEKVLDQVDAADSDEIEQARHLATRARSASITAEHADDSGTTDPAEAVRRFHAAIAAASACRFYEAELRRLKGSA